VTRPPTSWAATHRSVTKGDTSRRLDEKMKTVDQFKGNLMAAGLNKDASEAQRTRVAEIAIWMDEAKNSAKKLKKDRHNKSKDDGDGKGTPTAEKQGPKRDPSTTASNLNRFTMKQSRLGDAITPKKAPPWITTKTKDKDGGLMAVEKKRKR
jgi:hypothetical protein